MSDGPPKPRAGFLSHLLNYGVVSVLHKAIGLAMVPFYTSWLIEGEMGALTLTDLVLIVLIEIIGRQLLAGMSRHYFLAKDGRGARAVVSSTTLVVLGASWLVCGVAYAFREALTPLLLGQGDQHLGPERLATLLGLTFLIIPCALTSQAGFAYLLIRKHSRVWAGAQLAKTLLELGLKIVLVGVLSRGPEGYLTSVLIGEAAAAVLLTGGVLSRVGLRVERAALVPLVRFAMPLLPVGLFQLGLHQFDRRLLEHLAPGELGLTWAGIYGIGYLLGSTPASVLLNAVFAVWQPSIYAIQDPGERDRRHARDTTWLVLALALVCAAASLAGRPLVALLVSREGYEQAYRVLPWVACAYVFWGLYASIQLGFYSAQRTRPLIAVNLVALAANVALNWVLIPSRGYVGAALATLGAMAVLAAVSYGVSRRVCPLPLEAGRILGGLGLALAAAASSVLLDSATEGVDLAASLALRVVVLALFVAVVLGPMLRRDERDQLRGIVRAARRRLAGQP